MSPSFSSPREAGGFALLLAIILLLPVAIRSSSLPPRETIYASAPERLGPYLFLEQQIFKEKGDLDFVFMGSSHMWTAIDTQYVQKELGKKIGREAAVLSLGWPYPGFDAVFFVLQDLLQNRKVHTLVIYEECRSGIMPHPSASRWFRFGDCAGDISGLPFRVQAGFYADSVRGMSRNLLSLVRTDMPVDGNPGRTYWEKKYNAENLTSRFGSIAAHLGFEHNPDFAPYTPQNSTRPSDVCVYPSTNPSLFRFVSADLSYQDSFAKKIVSLARNKGVQVIVLHLPEINELDSPVIQERDFWPKTFSSEVTLMGIPPAKLFEGLKREEILNLFFDPGHMNKNGQEYFTKLITPCLLQTYAPIQN